MKFLKHKLTRIIAFAAACVITAVCTFRFTDSLLGYDKLTESYTEASYLSSYQFSHDVRDLYRELWLVGNMYLRCLDEDGNFTGNDELESSTENVLKKLGYMDPDGNLTIDTNENLEYYVSYNNGELSNTDKGFDELYDSKYSYVRENNGYTWGDDIYAYMYCDDYHWYSTNYGMYYYYLGFGEGAAVFDYDTTGLDFYTDELGADIYYKTDGTTPMPSVDSYDRIEVGIYNSEAGNYYAEYDNNSLMINEGNEAYTETSVNTEYDYEEEIMEPPLMGYYEYDEYSGEWMYIDANDINDYLYNGAVLNSAALSDGYFIYDDSLGGWVHITESNFTQIAGDEEPLKICIVPTAEAIAEYEASAAAYKSQLDSFIRSLVNMIPLALIVLVLVVYVIAAGGYRLEYGRFTLGKFDRVFAELPIVLIIAAVLGGVALISPDVIAFLKEFMSEYYGNTKMLPLLYSIAGTVLFAVIVEMLNTLVVRLKCRKFWKTTLVGRIFAWIYSKLKTLKDRIKKSVVSKEMLRNDIFTRKFFLMLVVFVVAEVILFEIAYDFDEIGFLVLGTLVLLGAYILLNMRDLKALRMLGEHISDINSGDYSKKEVPENSVTYGMTEKLNNISDGIQTAVERRVKSERMKIDLVTNVSHDLKTPLTSIISYINLLSAEELTPEARDYVKILEQKSERLNVIVADLFDLAKATSRTDIQLEMIDAVILTEQVLGDMSDKIKSFGREIRTDISMDSAPMCAEGKKLYRVLQNLIDNALKYSLDGTRIYLSLHESDGKAVLTLKNISAYEMKFTPEEITERFARGDESRTSEGNGLGLSIAKSFTEACGGEFRVIIDGDVFAAEIKMPLVTKKEENINAQDIEPKED